MSIPRSDGVGASARPSARSRARAKASGDDRFVLDRPADPSAGPPVEVAPVLACSLLDVQEALSRDSGAARADVIRHGEDVLDRLNAIRLCLLAGDIEPSRLQALADVLKDRRTRSGEPRLERLIGEIELRAQVELAKLRRR